MPLGEAEIKKYQILYKEQFGKKLTKAQASEQAHAFYRLMQLIYKPMKRSELEAVLERQQHLRTQQPSFTTQSHVNH